MNELSAETKRAIRMTWNAIAWDLENAESIDDNEVAVELTIDADRVAMYGSEAANEEIKAYLRRFPNYMEALIAISKQVQLV